MDAVEFQIPFSTAIEMRSSIRNQILIPFAALLTLTITGLSVSSAWVSVGRAEQQATEDLNQVIATLSSTSFPITNSILVQLRGLSGAEFVALDSDGRIQASTVSLSQYSAVEKIAGMVQPGPSKLGELQPVVIEDERWLAGSVGILRSRQFAKLLVLVREADQRALRRDAILAPLMAGVVALLGATAISWLIAAGFEKRLQRMQKHVAGLAALKFDEMLPIDRNDELGHLAESINEMAQDLRRKTEQIRVAERSAIISQLATGLAHQLRNAVMGARMAIQLHARRCSADDADSLTVAIRQLTLTESHIRGLLRLASGSDQNLVRGWVDRILDSVRDLLDFRCQHQGVQMSCAIVSGSGEDFAVRDSEHVQLAILSLVQNAMDACGPGGEVRIQLEASDGEIRVDIMDNGPGISAEIETRVFEPFFTAKQEGVGLGLALAAQAAAASDGQLPHDRVDDWTRFRFQIRGDN